MPSDRFDANAGFSINNTTVFDANRNLSAVGGTFSGNISAPNIVNSINGRTGAAALPLATSGVTGVASFNASDFVVSVTGSVTVAPVISSAARIYAHRGFR